MAGGNIDLGFTRGSTSTNIFGTSTTQKQLSQEGIDKIIYDVLSSDQGLAALGGVENASGGFKSSTKSLLSQDLITKIVGEIANITAPTVETAQKTESSNTKGSKLGIQKTTVICTELMRQNRLDQVLYEAGHAHFLNLPEQTVRGYRLWAEKLVPLLRKYSIFASAITPVARGRYEYIVLGKPRFWGYVTVFLGQPLCYLIGTCLKKDTITVVTE